ncbi:MULTISPECIES: ABC transporter permease subunit [Paenibacillus]|uniref:Protein lplB n=1 Tax=Paenibacillus odorifer TaxID=189426 RepID=A0A1R0Z0X0_9BACL|nr:MULTISPECIES: ABC transporter permease subunit [Paenibacillus]MEC0134304.1 ABC transporter permease subunit [Paenibacillus odorifer]MEC0222411.1 ABC transporter permease subunit [Paenibacillus odorifer]OMC96839.1 protein lplB [Paenibacillus odorifer]OMD04035.1 protein lplB [Paenibacillus odorifer]OMD15475.1 protein lplB [Paenibacillus odorifer]
MTNLRKYKALYLISLPGIIFFIVFKYLPLAGSIMAFQNYNIFKGFTGSPWVGLDQFRRMFTYPEFLRILENTILIGLYDMVFAFPVPIIFALLLNEVRKAFYKRILQTVVYLPHFLSWVIIGGIMIGILSPTTGIVNQILNAFGLDSVYFLGEDSYIRTILVGTGIWKDSGWGTIVYLAALAAVNPELYEAARIDGANRWKQTLSITIPTILPTIMIMFLLHIGNFLDFGFERVFVFINSLNETNGDILDTYIYRVGLIDQQYSYTTAIGLFKSVVGLLLVMIGNTLSKKASGDGLY